MGLLAGSNAGEYRRTGEPFNDVHKERDKASTFTGDEHLVGGGDRSDRSDHGAKSAAGLADDSSCCTRDLTA